MRDVQVTRSSEIESGDTTSRDAHVIIDEYTIERASEQFSKQQSAPNKKDYEARYRSRVLPSP